MTMDLKLMGRVDAALLHGRRASPVFRAVMGSGCRPIQRGQEATVPLCHAPA